MSGKDPPGEKESTLNLDEQDDAKVASALDDIEEGTVLILRKKKTFILPQQQLLSNCCLAIRGL